MEKDYRKCVFIVIYRRNKQGKFNYLILKRNLHWSGWEFPKGGIEKNEKDIEAVRREALEETGNEPYNIQDHYEEGKYKYENELPDREYSGQTYHLFSAEIKSKEVEIDDREHSQSLWLAFNEAYKKLTWQNQKDSLEIVDKKLKEQKNFRKSNTSSGILVLSGKDRFSNEDLVNSTYEQENVFHTQKPGSPFAVLKAEEVTDRDIKDAALICAAKSQDWRDSKSDVKVDWFKAKDIKKRKGMKKGTFEVNNKKQILIKKQDILKYKDK